MDEEQLRQATIDFMSRNYFADIQRLNSVLGRRLFREDMPPLPFAGNPFKLVPGKCIAVFGLNPKWSDGSTKRDINNRETCANLKRLVDKKNWPSFFDARASEFTDGPYYGTYFTGLGNHLATKWFGNQITATDRQQRAKETFRRFVFKSDVLPWLSTTTPSEIAKELLANHPEPIIAHQNLISTFVSVLKPRWIQFNGTSLHEAVEKFVDQKLDEEVVQLSKGRFRIYLGRIKKFNNVPIFMHPFVRRHLSAYSDFRIVADLFARKLEVDDTFN